MLMVPCRLFRILFSDFTRSSPPPRKPTLFSSSRALPLCRHYPTNVCFSPFTLSLSLPRHYPASVYKKHLRYHPHRPQQDLNLPRYLPKKPAARQAQYRVWGATEHDPRFRVACRWSPNMIPQPVLLRTYAIMAGQVKPCCGFIFYCRKGCFFSKTWYYIPYEVYYTF